MKIILAFILGLNFCFIMYDLYKSYKVKRRKSNVALFQNAKQEYILSLALSITYHIIVFYLLWAI